MTKLWTWNFYVKMAFSIKCNTYVKKRVQLHIEKKNKKHSLKHQYRSKHVYKVQFARLKTYFKNVYTKN